MGAFMCRLIHKAGGTSFMDDDNEEQPPLPPLEHHRVFPQGYYGEEQLRPGADMTSDGNRMDEAIWATSFVTLVPATSTLLYKPASGVVFGGHKIAYYTVLSTIMASGIGEAITAFLLSCPGGGSRRRVSFARAVLCASVVPLVGALAVAGYGFVKG